MTSDPREEEPMTLVAEPEVLVLRRSVQLPYDVPTAADLPNIDLDDVPFEIQDGALVLMPPPSPWHDITADKIRHFLQPHHAHVGEDINVAIGDGLRRPDVVGLSMSEDELLESGEYPLAVQVVEIAVEVISHNKDRAKDRISVNRDRQKKFTEYAEAGIPEYWIADEVAGDVKDASIQMYQLKDGAYGLVRTVRLSELLSEESEKSA
jgi:Uma2 family endonuclease